MPSLWKSGSASSRAKAGHRSIRGTISGPIPIPSTLDDEEEFPARTPDVGTTNKAMISDDEFPIRTPGAGIASPVPPGELDTTPEEEPTKIELAKDQALHPSPPKTPESGSEEEQVQVQAQAQPFLMPGEEPTSEGTRIETIQNLAPEAPSYPAPEPPTSIIAIAPVGRPASRSPPQRASPQRSLPDRVSPPRTSPLRAKTSPQARRITNPLPSSARYSVVSESPSKGSQNKDAPQRKKSTLRSALGRLFGRNKRKTTSGAPSSAPISEHESEPLSSSHHRSDPTALNRVKDMSPKRSASLPINEYDRPLRSHSIGPDDIMAIESARNSLQAEGLNASPAGGRRRAATAASSRLFYQPRIRDPEWGAGLSPRPASTQGRGSRLAGSGESDDPSEIGRAITSDSGNAGVGRRRSRSLSGLQDLTGARPGTRRRSDEIRFWRESYDPGFMSPLSSNPQDDADLDDTGVVDISAPESPAVERPPKTPPQPFNFGPISNEMVGMKITQAVSIDTRISNLEARSRKLERVVDQLCYLVPAFRAPPPDDTTALQSETPRQTTSNSGRPADQPQFVYTNAVPPTIPAIYQTAPAGAKNPRQRSSSRHSVETDSHSQASFGEAPTFVGSLHPPSTSVGQSRPQTTKDALVISVDRPTSTSTVRGATSLPIISQNVSGTQDQYAELVAQLEAERAARLALEAQVKKLSDRLNTLSSTMFAMVRDPAKSRSQERLTPSIGGSSPLLQPPKTLAVPLQEPLPGQATKALSAFETDEEDDEDESGNKLQGRPGVYEEKGESVTEEDFQTPREERPPHSYGAFGEELRPDDDDDFAGDSGDGSGGDEHKRRKAARTLSLSQLTLGKGKGQQTQI